jgi:hypothetical protein
VARLPFSPRHPRTMPQSACLGALEVPKTIYSTQSELFGDYRTAMLYVVKAAAEV